MSPAGGEWGCTKDIVTLGIREAESTHKIYLTAHLSWRGISSCCLYVRWDFGVNFVARILHGDCQTKDDDSGGLLW